MALLTCSRHSLLHVWQSMLHDRVTTAPANNPSPHAQCQPGGCLPHLQGQEPTVQTLRPAACRQVGA